MKLLMFFIALVLLSSMASGQNITDTQILIAKEKDPLYNFIIRAIYVVDPPADGSMTSTSTMTTTTTTTTTTTSSSTPSEAASSETAT